MTLDMCKHYRQLYDHRSDRQVRKQAVTILGSGVEIQGDPINLVVDSVYTYPVSPITPVLTIHFVRSSVRLYFDNRQAIPH